MYSEGAPAARTFVPATTGSIGYDHGAMTIDDSQSAIGEYVRRYHMERFLPGELLRNLRRFTYGAYETVLTTDARANHLFFLVEGQLQCARHHLNGKLAVLALSEPFAAIGDLELLTDRPILSTVVSTRPSTLLGVSVPLVERYGSDDPRFLRFLLDEVRTKMVESNELQLSHVLPVASRLALYMLARTARSTAPRPTLDLPPKESLASLLGTTTRHLNRVIADLVSGGAIEVAGRRVIVVDSSALELVIDR